MEPDVEHPQFPVALRGYDRVAVDLYVQKVTRRLDELEVNVSPSTAVKHALDRVGAETSSILAQAHATADQITTEARQEAEERLTSARAEAERTIAQANAQAEDIVRDAHARTEALDRDTDVIWQDRARLLGDLERIAADIRRVAQAAAERFPPEEGEGEELEAPGETTAPTLEDQAETIVDRRGTSPS